MPELLYEAAQRSDRAIKAFEVVDVSEAGIDVTEPRDEAGIDVTELRDESGYPGIQGLEAIKRRRKETSTHDADGFQKESKAREDFHRRLA